MKQLTIFMRNLDMGGAERILIDYLNQFDRTKFRVRLVLHTQTGSLLKDVPDDVSVFSVLPENKNIITKIIHGLFKRLIFSFPAIVSFLLKIRFGKSDIAVSFLEGVSTRIAALSSANKKVAWIHTDVVLNPWADRYYVSLKQEECEYNLFDELVFVSESGMSSFQNKFPNVTSKMSIIHNPVDMNMIAIKSTKFDENFEKWRSQTAGTFRIVSVGRLDPIKRFDLLLNAYKHIQQSEFSLTIIGDGAEMNELLEMSNDVENVYLLGQKNNPIPYVKNSDLYVNTSEVESYPTSVVEALLLEVPVLGVKNGGNEEVLGASQFGRLMLHSANAKEIADAIIEMKAAPESWQEKAKLGRQKIIDENPLSSYELVF